MLLLLVLLVTLLGLVMSKLFAFLTGEWMKGEDGGDIDGGALWTEEGVVTMEGLLLVGLLASESKAYWVKEAGTVAGMELGLFRYTTPRVVWQSRKRGSSSC